MPSLNSISKRVTPAGVSLNQCHMRAGSTDEITPHNYRDYSVRLVDHTRNSYEDLQVAAPPKAATSTRTALGSRFLSSLSNAQPAAAALSRKGSVLHSRAKSLVPIVPKLSTSNTSAPERTHTASKIFNDFFGGESAPIRLGAPVSPTKEKEESEFVMDYLPSFTERPVGMLRRRQTPVQIITSAPAHPSPPIKSSPWFGRKCAKPIPAKHSPQDDLATLDINAALFPNGPVDPLNPASFNDLLLMASSLLMRMQVAYKEKVDYIASIRPEIDAQQDEVEGAETRATHLKNQLEDISRRAQEQEMTMKEMARELAEEKMKSYEAQVALAATRTIRVVPNSKDDRDGALRQRRRGSSSNASDSGFESDIDSIFSSYSVPGTPLTAPDMSRVQSFDSRIENGRQASEREAFQAKKRTTVVSNNGVTQRLGREGAAWATVDVLRSENKELKKRVLELEETLQGCIELVSAVGGS